MLAHKAKCFEAQVVSLEQLVPVDNFYRALEAKLDLSFIYDLVRPAYSAKLGRPSIDPVVFFKLQLIMFFEGIRSERQLMDQVHLNLAYRWYLGYDLDEPIPDHSSLSRIRVRYGLGIFQQFFEQVVELCIHAGLVWGQELYFDGTKVRANAATESLMPRWVLKAKQHLRTLFDSKTAGTEPAPTPIAPPPSAPPHARPVLRLLKPSGSSPAAAPAETVPPPNALPLTEAKPESSIETTNAAPDEVPAPLPPKPDTEPCPTALTEQGPPHLVLVKSQPHPEPIEPGSTRALSSHYEWLIEKYDGTRLNAQRTSSYHRTTDNKVSRTDPDASPMNRFTGDRTKLGYHTHYVVDGGKARIILAALVTPASVMDNTPMLDLARWTRFRWQLRPKFAVGDTKYGTIENIVGLERDGLRAYVPTTDWSRQTNFYPAERFQYEAEHDLYRCPQGVELLLYSRREREEVIVYRAPAKVCNQCPVKAECTGSRSGRHIFRSFFQEYLDRVRGYHETEAFQKALRKRMVWVEPLFGEAKQWHQRARFRLRGIRKVNTEGLLTAAGQNIKRLLKHRTWDKRQAPGAATAAALADRPDSLSTDLPLAA